MSKIDKELVDPSVEPSDEKAHRTMRAALSAVPYIGGAAVESFSAIIEPPMERRKRAWMVQVTDALNELYGRELVTEDSLKDNEVFFTTLVHASNVALKNHQQEKLEALRNAVFNAALPNAPDEALQQIFLNIIDNCTVWHIALLRLFQGPDDWAKEKNRPFPEGWSMGGIKQVIEAAFPELRGQVAFYEVIWKDLYQRGLIGLDSLGTTMTRDGMLSKRTTGLGDQFLEFISAEPAA